MIKILIVLMILISLTSCKSWFIPADPTVELKDGTEIKIADLPEEIIKGIVDEGPTDMEKFFFYGMGALCIFGAMGILLVLKNIGYSAIAAGFGIFFCTVPFFLDLLYELLGPLKWIILVVIVAIVGSFLFLLFVKVRSLFHDLSHSDEDNIHAETTMIQDGAKNWKSMKTKLKKTIGLE